VLVAPSSNGFVNSRTINFQWQATTNATGYRLRVGTNPDPTVAPLVDVTLPVTTLNYRATFGSDYAALYWKVTASNDVGSDDSATWQVGIDQTPPVAAVSPLPAVSQESNFLVSWAAADDRSGVQCTDVQVRDGPGGGWADWFGCTALTFAGFQGQDGDTYYFRARARDNAGNVGTFAGGNGDASTTVHVGASAHWWNSAYADRRLLGVLNSSNGGLPVGYVLRLHLDGATAPTAQQVYDASRSAAKGDDVRIVYANSGEVPRLLLSFSSTAIDILFRNARVIPAATLDSTSYQLYYGNAAASNPPADPSQVLYPPLDPATEGLWWTQEGSGSTLHDASPNHNDATIAPGVGWVDGKFGRALSIQRCDCPVINAGASPSLNASSTISFELWLKPGGIAGRGRIAGQLGGGSNTGPDKWLLSYGLVTTDLRVALELWLVSGNPTITTAGQMVDGQWNHLAFTIDSANTLRLYLNGALDTTSQLSGPMHSGNTTLEVGSAEQIQAITGLVEGIRLSSIPRPSFPYGAFAAITSEPYVTADVEQALANLPPPPTPGPRVAASQAAARPAATRAPAAQVARSWRPITPLTFARDSLGAAQGSDGRAYAVGGVANQAVLGVVESYDPRANAWTARASLGTPRYDLAVAADAKGRIYAMGGLTTWGSTQPRNVVERYDATTNVWSQVAPMPSARAGHAAVLGPDGRIYVIGGMGSGGQILNSVDVYDPVADSWSSAPSLAIARADLAAALGKDGRIYAIGGQNAAGSVVATVEAFAPGNGSWVSVAPLLTARQALAAASTQQGTILAIGGLDGSTPLNQVESYDPGANTWSPVASLSTPRSHLAAASDSQGHVYALDGLGSGGDLSVAEQY